MNLKQKANVLPPALIVVFSCLCYPSIGALGQGMCVPERLRVSEVKGQVFSGYEGKQRPQADVTVEVTKLHNAKRVVARSVTDVDGYFHIEGIRPGKYWLSTKHHQLIGIDVELNVVATGYKSKTDVRRIVFVLGADPSKMCGGGHGGHRQEGSGFTSLTFDPTDR